MKLFKLACFALYVALVLRQDTLPVCLSQEESMLNSKMFHFICILGQYAQECMCESGDLQVMAAQKWHLTFTLFSTKTGRAFRLRGGFPLIG